jgi:isopentenyl phosphate kinase
VAQLSKCEKQMKVLELSLKPIVLKIGGSVITHEEKSFAANLSVIRRLAKEISEANVSMLILINGGGSFGHPLAKQYSIKEGYRGEGAQLLGFSKAQETMMTLNKFAVAALIQRNIPVVTISPSLLYCYEVWSNRRDNGAAFENPRSKYH